MGLGLTLGFATIECGRCGAARQRRFACGDCGDEPAAVEYDLRVQNRQRAVRTASSDAEDPSAEDTDAFTVLQSESFRELHKRIFRAAQLVATEDERGVERLTAVTSEVRALTAWAEQAAVKRPMVSVTRAVKSAAAAHARLYDAVIGALVEERLDRAQQTEAVVQRALDDAAEAAADAGSIVDDMNAVTDAADPVSAWVQRAVGDDYLGAGERGSALFHERTGLHGDVGAGFAALVMDRMIRTVGDPDIFWPMVVAHIDVLEAAGDQLADVVASEPFRRRYGEVSEDLWSAARRAVATSVDRSVREAASDQLEAGHLVLEQAIKFHLGIASAITTRRTFESWQAADVSELVNLARDRCWAVADSIPSSVIRNAFAHRDYIVDGDDVLLSPRRAADRGEEPEATTLVQLQDVVLGTVEAAAAMELALAYCAENRGLDEALRNNAHLFMPVVVSVLGWQNVEVQDDGPTTHVAATVAGPIPSHAVVFPIQPLASSVRTLVLHLRRDNDEAQITVDVDAYRSWSADADDLDKELRFARLMRSTTIDGEPFFGDAQLDKLLATRAAEIATDDARPQAAVIADLRKIRGLARELERTALNRALGQALRWRASLAAGTPMDTEEDTSPLLAYVGAAVEPPGTTLF